MVRVIGFSTVNLVVAASNANANPGGVTGWLLHFHGPTAYALVGFLAFAEAALLVGFFIPGETAVVIGGVLAGLGAVNLGVMIVVVVVCAIVGDSVGFEVGKRAGPCLLERRPLKGNAGVRRTVGMLEHYGGPAVFLGRFVAFARALIPGLAGMSGLRYRVFLFYNALGGRHLGGGVHPARLRGRAVLRADPERGRPVVPGGGGRHRGGGRRGPHRAEAEGTPAAGRASSPTTMETPDRKGWTDGPVGTRRRAGPVARPGPA